MISILNFGLGNIQSLVNALDYLSIKNNVIDSPKDILRSDKIILPGVGSFGKGIKNIKNLNFYEPLLEAVLIKKIPILGICLGFQLFANEGEEDGPNEGLKFVKGKVLKFRFKGGELKVPHIGFNEVYFKKYTIFENLNKSASFYFIHSYRFICDNLNDVSSICHYGEDFVSSIEKENIFGVQFHPEKSQASGLRVLQNFANL